MSEIKTFHHGVKTSKACVALLVAVSVLAQTGRGTDYVRLKGDDGSGSSAFFSSKWSDNRAPHSDADYIVTNNFLLRGPTYNSKPETNYVFGGRSSRAH